MVLGHGTLLVPFLILSVGSTMMDGQLRLRWRCAQAVSSDLTIQGHKKKMPLVRVSWVMDMAIWGIGVLAAGHWGSSPLLLEQQLWDTVAPGLTIHRIVLKDKRTFVLML
jgi:hypothetical protein